MLLPTWKKKKKEGMRGEIAGCGKHTHMFKQQEALKKNTALEKYVAIPSKVTNLLAAVLRSRNSCARFEVIDYPFNNFGKNL